MNPTASWQRATLLFSQSRWDLATTELRGLLTHQPEHAAAHALLAQALAQQDALDEALTEARQAVGLDPELAFAYHSLAAVLWHHDDYDAAGNAIERAIQLEPGDADHRSTLAKIRLAQKRWPEALAAADAGLQLEPEHTDCLNLRALALTRLGRGDEATDAVDASLAHDPDNPYTHQARGFALLHRGDANGALHHFQEALRRDPTLDAARAGLVEALKARNPIYRLALGWFLWLDRFATGRQMQILVGAWAVQWFGGKALRAAGYPGAATVLTMLWLALVLFTACSVPLFNLLLLLHPIGRHALERQARNDAILVGMALLVTLGVSLHAWLADAAWSFKSWIFWLVFLLPVSGIGLFHPGWSRRTLQVFCLVLFAAWLWWAIQLELLIAELRVDRDAPMGGSMTARVHDIDRVKANLGYSSKLVWAAALSTWFVLLAPKGRARRRRR